MTMKSPLTLLAIVTICAFVALGCSSDSGSEAPPAEPAEQDAAATSTEATMQVAYCGDCGHLKGSAACCDEDCEPCDCGFHKGSDLCCKEVTAGTDLCKKCGHAAGSDECCADECEVCESCGLHKGSSLCCKLGETEATPSAGG